MKAAIAESFNSLVRQRGIDKVTVKAVIEDCGISRQTFYYHFQDIMDVVEWCARQAVAHMVERSLAAASPQEALAELIRSTAENYTLLRKLMNSPRPRAPIWRSWRGAGPRPSGPSTATRTSRSTFSPSA